MFCEIPKFNSDKIIFYRQEIYEGNLRPKFSYPFLPNRRAARHLTCWNSLCTAKVANPSVFKLGICGDTLPHFEAACRRIAFCAVTFPLSYSEGETVGHDCKVFSWVIALSVDKLSAFVGDEIDPHSVELVAPQARILLGNHSAVFLRRRPRQMSADNLVNNNNFNNKFNNNN